MARSAAVVFWCYQTVCRTHCTNLCNSTHAAGCVRSQQNDTHISESELFVFVRPRLHSAIVCCQNFVRPRMCCLLVPGCQNCCWSAPLHAASPRGIILGDNMRWHAIIILKNLYRKRRSRKQGCQEIDKLKTNKLTNARKDVKMIKNVWWPLIVSKCFKKVSALVVAAMATAKSNGSPAWCHGFAKGHRIGSQIPCGTQEQRAMSMPAWRLKAPGNCPA